MIRRAVDAKLPVAVVAPTHDGAAGHDGARVLASGGDGGGGIGEVHIRGAVLIVRAVDAKLPEAVPAPARHPAAGEDGARVAETGRDSDGRHACGSACERT